MSPQSIGILLSSLFVVLLAVGCASDSIARRKQERLAAYSALPASQQMAVDQGRLLHGMSTNAAYIAWGRPTEIISEGAVTTWLYSEQEYREDKHITISGAFAEERKVLNPRRVVRATITIENGRVTSWSRTPSSPDQKFQ